MILTLLILFLTSQKVEAQDFLRRTPRVRIGTVLKVKGNVVGLGSADRTLQYLKRGDKILDHQSIVTRNNSQIQVKIGLRSRLVLASNTKVNFIFLQSENRYLVRLIKGVARYRFEGAGTPELFISGRSYGTYYSSYEFDAVLKKSRFYFKPADKTQIIKYQRRGTKKNTLSVTKKDIELLSQSGANDTPVYYIKNAKKLPAKSVKRNEKSAPTVPQSDALAEAAAIFGDSVSQSSPVSDVADVFGDNSNKSEAADIFGEEVDTKSTKEKLKLKDNIGVKLEERKRRPLPRVGVLGGKPEPSAFEELDLSLFLKSTFYANEPTRFAGDVDNQSFHQDIRLTFGNKVKINDVESLTLSGWLDASNRKEVYNELGETLDLQSSKRNHIYLNEFYYTYTTRKFDIQFGKKVIRTGKGIIYNPSDSFTAVDATIPTSPLFLGSFMVSVDYYFSGWNLTGILFPAIIPNKSPTQNSRWTTLYSDINFELEQEFPSGFSPKSKQIFLKLEGTKWGTDWQFSFFNGPNNNPVIRNDIIVNNNVPTFTLVQEHIPITFMAAGFSTTFGGLELHGEILNQNAEDGKDDSFTSMMLGFRYVMDTWPKNLGLNSIDIVFEHGRESLRSAQSQPFYALSSIGARFYQNSYVGTTIFNVTDDFSFNYDFHFDLENDGSAQILGMNYNAGSSQWRLKLELYDGEDTSNFGQWRDNDNTSLEYVYNW